MLPQFGFTELLMVAIVALIVLGPTDFPRMMRSLGQFVARGRRMASEFQSAFDDIARQAELDDLRDEIESLKRDNALTAAVDDLKSVEADINVDVMRAHPSGARTGDEPAAPAPHEASEAPPPKASET